MLIQVNHDPFGLCCPVHEVNEKGWFSIRAFFFLLPFLPFLLSFVSSFEEKEHEGNKKE